MDLISVYFKDLSGILHTAKNQGILVKLQNKSGAWSDHFYKIEAIKEFTHRQFDLTTLILYNPVEDDSTVIDIKSISGVELQSPSSYEGKIYSKLKVVNAKAA
jgi:hypothetical protein